MSQAIFRETTDMPEEHRSRFADVELVDVGVSAGFVAVVVGLGMIWLPLALVVPGAFVMGLCLWRILRPPRPGQ